MTDSTYYRPVDMYHGPVACVLNSFERSHTTLPVMFDSTVGLVDDYIAVKARGSEVRHFDTSARHVRSAQPDFHQEHQFIDSREVLASYAPTFVSPQSRQLFNRLSVQVASPSLRPAAPLAHIDPPRSLPRAVAGSLRRAFAHGPSAVVDATRSATERSSVGCVVLPLIAVPGGL